MKGLALPMEGLLPSLFSESASMSNPLGAVSVGVGAELSSASLRKSSSLPSLSGSCHNAAAENARMEAKAPCEARSSG